MSIARPLLISALFVLAVGCEDKKKPPPSPVPSGESTSSPNAQSTSDLVALPPGYVAPDAAVEASVTLIKTGVCSFQESGYDGQDTKSNEKIVIKIKDDKLVAAEYTYRGSYAIDGKTESLSIPVRQGEWMEFEFPMNSGGSKTFKARIKKNDVEFKGVAAQNAQGSCTWVETTAEEDEKKDGGKDDKGKKDKSGKKK
jgi:hypothetical protein